MSVCKKTMVLMIACLLLATAFSMGTTQAVATEEPDQLPAQVFDFAGAQVCTDADGNYALRFVFKMGCTGVTRDKNYNTVISQDAKVCIEGQAYPLVGFGANVALDYDTVAALNGTAEPNDNLFNANGDEAVTCAVPAKKLYDINNDGTVTYTVRVISIPVEELDTDIYAKAYILYRDGDEVKTHTTQVYSRSYRKTFFAANSPKAGDVVHEYLTLGAVTVDLETNTGTMVVKNVSKWYETEQSESFLVYTCYDKDDKSLGDVRINIGRIRAGKGSNPLSFTLPDGTYSMQLKKVNVEFWTDWY